MDTGAATTLATRADVRVADGVIRPARRDLCGPVGEVAIEPRVMQVLLALVDAGGAVMTRDTLLTRCWPGLLVGDDALSRTIFEIRRAMRAAGIAGFTVETIPKSGYRLAVAASDPAGPDAPAVPPPAWSRRALIGGGIAAAAAGAVAWWRLGATDRLRADALIGDGDRVLHDAEHEEFDDPTQRAVKLYRTAVARDPANARGWGRLALAERDLTLVGDPADMDRAAAECRAAANRALAIDPGQPDAATAIATLPKVYGAWLPARHRLDAVLTRHPNHAEAVAARADLDVETGLIRAAHVRSAALLARDRGDRRWRNLAVSIDWAAADAAAFARDLPGLPRASTLGRQVWMLVWQGRTAAALALAEGGAGALVDMPAPLRTALHATLIALDTGVADDRAKAIAACLAMAEHGHTAAQRTMLWLGSLGATDAAFSVALSYYLGDGPIQMRFNTSTWSDTAALRRPTSTRALFLPHTASLRADPRFVPLCRAIGLVDYWRATGCRPDFLGNRPLPV